MGKVRMADIAAKVGVSTVTVHNALPAIRALVMRCGRKSKRWQMSWGIIR